MRLRAPVEYWTKRSKDHKKWTRHGIAYFALGIFGFGVVLVGEIYFLFFSDRGARLLETASEVYHRRWKLLRQKKLTAALDVMPAAALDRPTATGEDPRHLITPQVCPRRAAVAEAMPHKREAVRVDAQRVEAARQDRAQRIRGWK